MNELVEAPERTQVEEQVPTIFIELVDQGDSGFFQDDTRDTPTPVQLRAPGVRMIPNVGFRRGIKTETVDGVERKTRFNEQIRYIKNEEVISVNEQKRLGIEPSSLAQEDKILVLKGYATITREGTQVGLYDYIVQSYYNESNLERSEKATAIYRIMQIDQQAEQFNEDELLAADALKYVGSLYQKTGKNKYQYNEEKINAVCELLSIYADSPATRIKTMLIHAKQRPEWFLNKVHKLEQTTVVEVTHALELSVVRFNGNVAEYAKKDKILKSMGGGKMSHDQKITRLADWLRTGEGHEAYMELKAEIEAAKATI